jgi:hypothetical protein
VIIGAAAWLALPAQSAPIFQLEFCGDHNPAGGALGGGNGCIFYDAAKATDIAVDYGPEGSSGDVPVEIRLSSPIHGDRVLTADEFEQIMVLMVDLEGGRWPELLKGWMFEDTVTNRRRLAVFPVDFMNKPGSNGKFGTTLPVRPAPEKPAPVSAGNAVVFANNNVQLQQVPAPAALALFGIGLAGLGIWRRKKH